MKKLITLSCFVFYAIISHAQTSGDYRSVKSGNWTDFATVWQRFNGTTWVAASAYPTSTDKTITISDTTNVTINTNLTIDQTIVAPGGQLTLLSSYTVTLAGATDALTVNGQFNWASGTLASTGSIKINGTLQWTGGSLQTTLNNKGTISIAGNVYVYSALTNSATINWYSDYIYFENGSLTNNAEFNVLSNGNLYNSNGGTFTNASTGIFNQSNGDSYSTSNITFNNKGVMNLNTGVFSVNSGTFTNTKKIVFDGGSFENHATANFNAGTAVSGSGTITQVYNSWNVNLALSIPASITTHITGGTIAGSGSLKITGLLNWDAGAINVATTILGTGVVNIGSGNVDLYSTITNNGTINWLSSYIYFRAGTIINNKKFNVYGNGAFYNSSGGTFTNSAAATFEKLAGTGSVTNQITFTNAGTLKITSGEFYNNGGTFSNTGTINFNGGNLDNYTTMNLNSGTVLTGAGSIIATYNTINMNAAITLPAGINLYVPGSGATIAGTGSLKITDKMFWYAGSVNVPLTMLGNSQLNIGVSNVNLYSTLTNNGVINWTNGYIYFRGGSIVNNKTFNILNDTYLYKYTSGTFINSKTGVVNKSSSGITNVTILFTNEGTIKGTGSFAFATNLTNTGIFDPGVSSSTGILSTGTDYTNKTLAITMNGSSAGTGYDRLLVTGNVKLGADTLKVTASDTMPAGSYIILKWTGARTGTFKVTQLPPGYTVSYSANKVIVNVPVTGKPATDAVAENVKASSVNDNSFSVFPNPAKQTININYGLKSKSGTLQIFDVDGKAIKQFSIMNNSSLKVDVSRFAAGTYVLQLTDGTIIKSAKFIKQ